MTVLSGNPMYDVTLTHTADPFLQLAVSTGDFIAPFIALVALSACAARMWKKMRRKSKAAPDLEDDDRDLGVPS